MFDLVNTAILVLSFFNLSLAVLILFRALNNRANRFFALVILTVVMWQLTMFFYRAALPGRSLIWCRLLYTAASLIPSTFVLFTYLFPDRDYPARWKIVALFLSNLVIIGLIFHPTILIRGVGVPSFGEKIIYWGPAYPLFVFYITASFGWAYQQLFKGLLSSRKRRRMQYILIILGTLSTTSVALLTNLFLPWLSIFQFNWAGQVMTILLVGAISYAIVRHRFMDIRLAVRAVLFRLMMVTILGVLFVGAVSVYRQLPQYDENEMAFMAISAFLTAVVVALFYRPLEIFLKVITDRVFFQREYTHQQLISSLGKEASESVNLDQILQKIEDAFQEVMKVRYVGFVILQDEIENRRLEENGRVEARGPSEIMLRGFAEEAHPWKVEDVLLKEMEYDPRVVVVDELRRDIEAEKDPLRRKRQQKILKALEDLEAAVLAPLPSKEGLLGVMALGEKKSMEAFTVQDIQAVEAVVYQSGIAIENAVLFEQVRNFNRRLRQEIREATRDLALKNKNLSVLRNLDQIIINTLEFEELGKKLVDVVAWEMGYVGALLCYVDEEARQLRGLALSESPGFKRVRKLLGREVNQYSLDLDLDPSNLLIRSLRERKSFHSADLAAFLTPLLNKKIVQKIQQVSGIRHAVSFSLSSKGRSLGVILIGLSKSFQELETNELELLQSFVNEAGIALENAKMYTEVRGINQQLVEANARLKELDRMKDELVSIASHELRTPMSAIKSYVYMALEKRSDEVSDKVREYLRKAYDSSERMIRLINDMLSVSRLDTGRLKVDPQPMEIGGLVKEVTEELSVTAGEKNIGFELDLPNEIPPVWADKDRIREVLVNLLGNAIKFSFPNSAVRVGAREEGDRVLVAVTDDGPGMSWDDQERLFKKFSRLQHSFSTMAEGQGGTGLGLYISKGIVELHGGEIWVESEEGKGSTFTFSLRIVEKT